MLIKINSTLGHRKPPPRQLIAHYEPNKQKPGKTSRSMVRPTVVKTVKKIPNPDPNAEDFRNLMEDFLVQRYVSGKNFHDDPMGKFMWSC